VVVTVDSVDSLDSLEHTDVTSSPHNAISVVRRHLFSSKECAGASSREFASAEDNVDEFSDSDDLDFDDDDDDDDEVDAAAVENLSRWVDLGKRASLTDAGESGGGGAGGGEGGGEEPKPRHVSEVRRPWRRDLMLPLVTDTETETSDADGDVNDNDSVGRRLRQVAETLVRPGFAEHFRHRLIRADAFSDDFPLYPPHHQHHQQHSYSVSPSLQGQGSSLDVLSESELENEAGEDSGSPGPPRALDPRFLATQLITPSYALPVSRAFTGKHGLGLSDLDIPEEPQSATTATIDPPVPWKPLKRANRHSSLRLKNFTSSFLFEDPAVEGTSPSSRPEELAPDPRKDHRRGVRGECALGAEHTSTTHTERASRTSSSVVLKNAAAFRASGARPKDSSTSSLTCADVINDDVNVTDDVTDTITASRIILDSGGDFEEELLVDETGG
jgi:hypothetical protein